VIEHLQNIAIKKYEWFEALKGRKKACNFKRQKRTFKNTLRFCITDKVAIFLSNLFDKIIGRAKIKNFNKKLSRNVAAIFFENIEKSGMRTITRDMHESGNKRTCEFQPDIQKFLVTFDNENLFVNPAVKGHFSGYVRLPKNLRTTLCCDFCVDHRYRKNNKGRRAVSCEADEGLDSGSKWLLYLSADSRL
jgi:hypothetical protein